MQQGEARRRAKELGGIAVSAHQKLDSGGAPAAGRGCVRPREEGVGDMPKGVPLDLVNGPWEDDD